MKRIPVEANLAEYNKDPQQYRDGGLGVHTPADMPVYVKAFRLTKDGKVVVKKLGPGRTAPALSKQIGWTLELDFFTFGVKVYCRVDKEGTLKVFSEDIDGITKLEEWVK